MRKLIFLALSIISAPILFAQGDWCATDEMLEQYFETHPDQRAKFYEEATFTSKQLLSKDKSSSHYIIPIVVHVMHYNGDGNISKAQILDGLRILNDDFNKRNSDTASVRNIFKGLIANPSIEFRLAKKDPQGNCTEGITRHNTLTTYEPLNRDAPKAVVDWDPYSYLNIWIVNSINSGSGSGVIGGFAQFPSGGSASTYGLVVRNVEWGSIGTGVNGTFYGRVPSHEIGHCLNLFHPFQSGCGNNCLSSGDRVCDTPPQASSNNNSCNTNLNTCSNDATGGSPANPNPYNSNVPDQIENLMGYGIGCQKMFTKGQKSRIDASIQNYNILNSITTPNNLIQTGTNDGYANPPCVPTAQVKALNKFACIGDTVTFTEESLGGPVANYNWSFPGGTPSSSTAAEPKITYAAAGNYQITLRVSNASGVDSLVLNNYVKIANDTGKYSADTYFEAFENSNTFANDWTILNLSSTPNWQLANFVGNSGTGSIWINNLSTKREGEKNALISPTIDMTTLAKPTINFDVAYSRVDNRSDDGLNLYVSADCGATWNSIISAQPLFYAFDRKYRTQNFMPTDSSQWKSINLPTVVIPSQARNSTHVRFKFEFVNKGGNNVYIDNFTLNNQLSGVAENIQKPSIFALFPNPANQQTTLKLEVNDPQMASIYVSDILGKRVGIIFEGKLKQSTYTFNVDLSKYDSGMYFISIKTANGLSTQKLIVQ